MQGVMPVICSAAHSHLTFPLAPLIAADTWFPQPDVSFKEFDTLVAFITCCGVQTAPPKPT